MVLKKVQFALLRKIGEGKLGIEKLVIPRYLY